MRKGRESGLEDITGIRRGKGGDKKGEGRGEEGMEGRKGKGGGEEESKKRYIFAIKSASNVHPACFIWVGSSVVNFCWVTKKGKTVNCCKTAGRRGNDDPEPDPQE